MCDRCVELQRQLDIRNENTKVWIQADTQTRAYAYKLERELEVKDPVYKRATAQTWADNPYWVTDDLGATWNKVPCTGRDKLEAHETLLHHLGNYSILSRTATLPVEVQALKDQIASLNKTIAEQRRRLHKQFITCYYCGVVLHTIEDMGEYKVYSHLDCTKCR